MIIIKGEIDMASNCAYKKAKPLIDQKMDEKKKNM